MLHLRADTNIRYPSFYLFALLPETYYNSNWRVNSTKWMRERIIMKEVQTLLRKQIENDAAERTGMNENLITNTKNLSAVIPKDNTCQNR